MNKSFLKKNILMKIISNSLIYLPTPVSINLWWNFGSLLGMCLMIQIITGLLLSMHYTSDIDYSFWKIIYIMKDVNYGWLMRLMHMNTASFFFICLYIHLGRGLYYGSFKLMNTWLMGVLIMLMLMSIAFMGYVLPWGQMSYWGATVITNLLTVFPYLGLTLVEWLWGGYSVDNATLSRFYTLHFFLPFILLMMVMLHLMFLHETGSNNPLGLKSNFYKIIFHNYFTIKDLLGFMYLFLLMTMVILQYPYMLADPSNFIMSSYKTTPIHIQPEWYFLFAYTILRSIPNKLSGVIGLLMSILILMILPFLNNMNFQGMSFYPMSQMYFWMFIYSVIFLTWLGMQGVSSVYSYFSKYLTLFYFMYFLFNYYLIILWDKIMN